jgi:hypothetical protein
MKTFTVSPQLQSALEHMSRDMAVSVEGLVNQAIFNWARLHGYLEPGKQPAQLEEPDTTRVPVIEDGAPDWSLASGGSFSSPRLAPVVKQRFVLVLKDREVPVDSDRFLVGRDVSCDLTIEAPRISRQHAMLHTRTDALEVEDLGSSNGTWFQGERVTRRELQHGDEVHFGDVAVRVELR